MFVQFFHALKQEAVPVSLREYLTLLEAMDARVISNRVENFYYLARAALVKDESHFDKFDRVFGSCFKGLESMEGAMAAAIPEEWLRSLAEKFLTEEEKEKIRSLGGWEKLMETLKKRLAEQKGRHQGGDKWIGTGGTSPFGADGYNPEGVRIGQSKGRHGKAAKVWDRRDYKNLDGDVELGTRTMKMALRRLRRFAREGEADMLDVDGTIRATANRGLLDIQMMAERRNRVKVLLFLDVGGSMDPHVKLCEELFSAARASFKNLDSYYFHNCLYEFVWVDNRRRHQERTSTWDVLHRYSADYKIIFVGDASMSPYEIAYAGGSVEHWNDEPGGLWLERVCEIYQSAVWLNPVPQRHWEHMPSTQAIRRIFRERMFPLTLDGLDDAMAELARLS